MNSSRNSFKSTTRVSESRAHRHHAAIVLRKQKQSRTLALKRTVPREEPDYLEMYKNLTDFSDKLKTIVRQCQLLEENNKLIDSIPFLLTQKELRRILRSNNAPVKEVIEQPIILAALAYILEPKHDHLQELQIEATWSLVNIAVTKYASNVASASGVVNNLIRLANSASSHEFITENTLWCLGNLAADSLELRVSLLNEKSLRSVFMKHIQDPKNPQILRAAANALANALRDLHKAPPDRSITKPFAIALQSTCEMLLTTFGRDLDILDAMEYLIWCLKFIADIDFDERPRDLFDIGTQETLIRVLRAYPSEEKILIPVLETLDSIASGDNTMTASVIKAGFLEYALGLLKLKNKRVQKETCRILSQLTFGTSSNCEAVIMTNEMDLFKRVNDISRCGDYNVKKEALWTISNAVLLADKRLMQKLHKCHVIRSLTTSVDTMSTTADCDLVVRILDAIRAILEKDDKLTGGSYKLTFEEYRLEEALNNLLDIEQNQNDDIAEKASEILVLFFGDEEDDDYENIDMLPSVNGDEYKFGYPNVASPSINKQLFPGSPIVSPLNLVRNRFDFA